MYLVATSRRLTAQEFEQAFAGDGVALEFESRDTVALSTSHADLRIEYDSAEAIAPWLNKPLLGTRELRAHIGAATGCYRVYFRELTVPQTLFEALWVARVIAEMCGGAMLDVTSLQMHSATDLAEMTELDFDIRDHIVIHSVDINRNGKLWLHSHGMAKFGARDLEVFDIDEHLQEAGEIFLRELGTEYAFSHGPPLSRIMRTTLGGTFMVVADCERKGAAYCAQSAGFLTVLGGSGTHTVCALLAPYLEAANLGDGHEVYGNVETLLPAFKARFLRRGLLEPITFMVRAAFEITPRDGLRAEESLWLEIVHWNGHQVIGKLLAAARASTEWRKGSQVQVDETQISALGMNRNGKQVPLPEVAGILQGERPS